MKKIVSLAVAGSLTLALAACGGGSENVTTNVETNVIDLTDTGNDMGNMDMPEPTPSPSVTPAPAPPPQAFGNEAQTQDDADATGDTARVSRGTEDDTAPAQ